MNNLKISLKLDISDLQIGDKSDKRDTFIGSETRSREISYMS